MNIILSIHPKWAEKIYSREKTIEWRKNMPHRMNAYKLRDGDPNFKVYLYETAPVRMITGFFCWGGVAIFDARHMHEGFPPATYGCVNVEDLKKYQGENCAICGWFIDLPQKFKEPKSLEDFGLERPPQSWQYTEVEA